MTNLRRAFGAAFAVSTLLASTLAVTAGGSASAAGGAPSHVAVAKPKPGKPHKPPYYPPTGAVFNNPRGSRAAQYSIVNTVNQAINHAKPGSFVYITDFLLDSRASASALINARNRGARVQVVLDGNAHNGQTRRLGKALNKDNRKLKPGEKRRWPDGVLRKWGRDRSFVKWCKGSCRDGGDPNHAKFYVFTRTGAAKNVIMVSSSNLNKGGANKGFNDMIILQNQDELTQDFAGVLAEMAEDSPNDHDGYLEYKHDNVVARFFPKKAPGDPVLTDLKRVRCNQAAGGAGHHGHTAINIAMFRWNNKRGFQLARKLVKMDRAGCDVKIVYGAPGTKVVQILKDSARHGGIELWDSRHFTETDPYGERDVDLRTHSKYLLISGATGKDRSVWSVQTGSANWGRSLHAGDENTITVEDRSIYRQYLDNWKYVVNTASFRVR